jgi:hypothetical protein
MKPIMKRTPENQLFDAWCDTDSGRYVKTSGRKWMMAILRGAAVIALFMALGSLARWVSSTMMYQRLNRFEMYYRRFESPLILVVLLLGVLVLVYKARATRRRPGHVR